MVVQPEDPAESTVTYAALWADVPCHWLISACTVDGKRRYAVSEVHGMRVRQVRRWMDVRAQCVRRRRGKEGGSE